MSIEEIHCRAECYYVDDEDGDQPHEVFVFLGKEQNIHISGFSLLTLSDIKLQIQKASAKLTKESVEKLYSIHDSTTPNNSKVLKYIIKKKRKI